MASEEKKESGISAILNSFTLRLVLLVTILNIVTVPLFRLFDQIDEAVTSLMTPAPEKAIVKERDELARKKQDIVNKIASLGTYSVETPKAVEYAVLIDRKSVV